MFLFDFRHTGGRTRYLILGNRSGPEHIIIATYIYMYNKTHEEKGMRRGRSQPPQARETIRDQQLKISRAPHM